jgi:hypothetical protein
MPSAWPGTWNVHARDPRAGVEQQLHVAAEQRHVRAPQQA